MMATFIGPLLTILVLPAVCFMLPPDSEAKLDIHVGVMQAYAVFQIVLSDNIAPYSTALDRPIFGKF